MRAVPGLRQGADPSTHEAPQVRNPHASMAHARHTCLLRCRPEGAGRQGTPPVGVGGALGMTRPVPWTEGSE